MLFARQSFRRIVKHGTRGMAGSPQSPVGPVDPVAGIGLIDRLVDRAISSQWYRNFHFKRFRGDVPEYKLDPQVVVPDPEFEAALEDFATDTRAGVGVLWASSGGSGSDVGTSLFTSPAGPTLLKCDEGWIVAFKNAYVCQV
mgnify:CR=1 FL=1